MVLCKWSLGKDLTAILAPSVSSVALYGLLWQWQQQWQWWKLFWREFFGVKCNQAYKAQPLRIIWWNIIRSIFRMLHQCNCIGVIYILMIWMKWLIWTRFKPSFEVKAHKYDPIKFRFTSFTQTKIKMSTMKWKKLIITSTIARLKQMEISN